MEATSLDMNSPRKLLSNLSIMSGVHEIMLAFKQFRETHLRSRMAINRRFDHIASSSSLSTYDQFYRSCESFCASHLKSCRFSSFCQLKRFHRKSSRIYHLPHAIFLTYTVRHLKEALPKATHLCDKASATKKFEAQRDFLLVRHLAILLRRKIIEFFENCWSRWNEDRCRKSILRQTKCQVMCQRM